MRYGCPYSRMPFISGYSPRLYKSPWNTYIISWDALAAPIGEAPPTSSPCTLPGLACPSTMPNPGRSTNDAGARSLRLRLERPRSTVGESAGVSKAHLVITVCALPATIIHPNMPRVLIAQSISFGVVASIYIAHQRDLPFTAPPYPPRSQQRPSSSQSILAGSPARH